MNWPFIASLLIGGAAQWFSLNFARRVGLRRGRYQGWCKGFQEGSEATLEIMTRLGQAGSREEAMAIRDEMLAELEGVKH